MAADPLTEVRLDLWLHAARFFKTRALSKAAVESGKVQVNQLGVKPAKALHVGDTLTIRRGELRQEVVVLALSAVRGSAPVAQMLYQETEASSAARAQALADKKAGGNYEPPEHKPNKRDRRLIHRFESV